MGSKRKSKTVYYLVTEKEIFRTDEILEQVDRWIQAFISGRMIRAPYADPPSLEEFEVHLEKTLLETQQLIQNEFEF